MKRTVIIIIFFLATGILCAQSDSLILRLGFSGGYGYRLADPYSGVSEELNNYISEMKSLFVYGFDLSGYYKWIGAGFNYSRFNTKNNLDSIIVYDEHKNIVGTGMSDRLNCSFVGAGVYTLFYLTRSHLFAIIPCVSPGLFFYEQQSTRAGQSFNVTAKPAFGIRAGLSIDYRLSSRFGFNFEAAGFSGSIRKLELNDEDIEKETPESLHRVDFTIGIRFYP